MSKKTFITKVDQAIEYSVHDKKILPQMLKIIDSVELTNNYSNEITYKISLYQNSENELLIKDDEYAYYLISSRDVFDRFVARKKYSFFLERNRFKLRQEKEAFLKVQSALCDSFCDELGIKKNSITIGVIKQDIIKRNGKLGFFDDQLSAYIQFYINKGYSIRIESVIYETLNTIVVFKDGHEVIPEQNLIEIYHKLDFEYGFSERE